MTAPPLAAPISRSHSGSTPPPLDGGVVGAGRGVGARLGAGVALGKSILGLPYPVRLICPMHWPWHIPTRMADDANAAADLLGSPHRLAATDLDADESYVEPGYGLPSAAGREAMHLLATTEAILLDHVYTAKALAALEHTEAQLAAFGVHLPRRNGR